MDGLPTLIKISRQRMDTLRASMATLEARRDELERAQRVIDDARARERVLAAEARDADMVRMLGTYEAKLREDETRLAEAVINLEDNIRELQEQIWGQFQEMKRYETAAEHQRTAAEAEAARVEQAALDALAEQMTLRKRKEEETV